jgi:hypothetical protein
MYVTAQKERTYQARTKPTVSSKQTSLTLDSILPYLLSLFLLTGGMLGFTARFRLHNLLFESNNYVLYPKYILS